MPRPRIDKDNLRSKILTFRCTLVDAKDIKLYCKSHKIGLLDLVFLGMKRAKPKHFSYPILKGVKTELYRIGNNLNQISKALNSNNKTARILASARIKELQELREQLIKINEQIK